MAAKSMQMPESQSLSSAQSAPTEPGGTDPPEPPEPPAPPEPPEPPEPSTPPPHAASATPNQIHGRYLMRGRFPGTMRASTVRGRRRHPCRKATLTSASPEDG